MNKLELIECQNLNNTTIFLLLLFLSRRSFPPRLPAVVHIVPQREEHAPIGSQGNQSTCGIS